MFVLHAPHVHSEVRRLVELGINDCEISRRLGVPRTTVRDIRRPTYVPKRSSFPRECFWRCWRATKPVRFSDERYAYLLGLYLGDGTIVRSGRTYRLRIFLDARYSGIIEEAEAALVLSFPSNLVGVFSGHRDGGCTVVSIYSGHLPCVFPQHGRGRKHERPIRLEQWQQNIVDESPWELIRGLILSDGCRYVNPTGKYRYVSYDFCQVSDDIRAIFTRACDQVGVEYRDYGRSVRIYRRASVDLLDAHVGPKC